jgi:hypothetical protein
MYLYYEIGLMNVKRSRNHRARTQAGYPLPHRINRPALPESSRVYHRETLHQRKTDCSQQSCRNTLTTNERTRSTSLLLVLNHSDGKHEDEPHLRSEGDLVCASRFGLRWPF